MKKLLIVSLLTLSAGSLFAETAPPPANAEQPLDQIMKQNYVDLTNWVKEIAAPKTGDLLNKTGDFAAEQTPLFIKEFIAWQIWSNLTSFLLGVIFFTSFLIIGIKCLKNSLIDNKDWSEFRLTIPFGVVSGIVSAFSLLFLVFEGFGNLQNAIKAMVSPRVVIVEKAAELIKK